MKYLGELYIYRLIGSAHVFETLWLLVTFGHRAHYRLEFLIVTLTSQCFAQLKDGPPLTRPHQWMHPMTFFAFA